MKRRAAVLALTLCLPACGAVSSISPFISTSELRFDPRLIGSWTDSAGKEVAVVTADGAGGYAIRFSEEDGKVGRFVGRLGLIGTYRVLDIQPARIESDASDAYRDLMLRLHTFLLVDSIGATLQLRAPELDSLKDLVEREPSIVSHTIVDSSLVLTASTSELHRFVLQHIERPGFFGKLMLRRRSP